MLGYSPRFVLPSQPLSQIHGGSPLSLFPFSSDAVLCQDGSWRQLAAVLRIGSWILSGVRCWMVCWQQAIATECQLPLDTRSDPVCAITISITPFGSHVLSSHQTYIRDPIPSSTLQQTSMCPVAVDKSFCRLDSGPCATQGRNVANFQGTNPKTWVVCAPFCFIKDNVRSF